MYGSAVCAVFKSVCVYLKIYVVKSALCVAESLLLLKVCVFESLGYGSQVTGVVEKQHSKRRLGSGMEIQSCACTWL